MSAFSALDRGTRIAILLAGGALAAGAGYLGWQMTRPAPVGTVAEAPATDTAPKPAPAAEATSEPAADPAAAPAPEPAPEPEPAPDPEPASDSPARSAQPAIDTWRVTAEGEAVVSGKAEPGAKIEVIVDDQHVASGDASSSGDFAILFTLPPNPKPSLMWLSMTLKDQPPLLSEEMVALGPIAGPPPVATAEAPSEDIATTESPAAPPALLLSDEGAVILQDPAPAAEAPQPATVMIDTIAYTLEGEVQVGGRGAGGATLRLYLDNAEKTTVQIPATGLWVTTLPDTPPGIYTLRVDQLDASGKVTSRFETPFKRETLDALAAASGQEPSAEPAPETLAAAEPEAPVQPEPPAAQPDPIPATEAVAATEATPKPTETAAPQETTAAAQPAREPDAQPEAEPTANPVTVTVQPGFTLWGIAQDTMGDGVMYVQVFEANKDKIKNPDLIYPGQVFTMPEAASSP